MKFTVRVDDTAHSVYQAEFTENTSISESAEIDSKGFHLTYDEWDFEKRKYKEYFCKSISKNSTKTDANYYQNTILKNNATLLNLRKILTNLNNKMQKQKRQNKGEEFEIDAITDLYVDVHSKKHLQIKFIFLIEKKKKIYPFYYS